MPQPIPLPLGLQSSPGRYSHDAGGRLINAYHEEADDTGKAKLPVWAIEGLAPLSTIPNGGRFRGGIQVDGYGYIVSDTTVVKIDPGGGVTTIGAFAGSDPVFMARNRKATPQIALVSGGIKSYIENDTIATISDNDLPSPNSVTQLDGYGIYTIEDGRVFISAIDEFTDIDPLDFATAEANADKLRVGYARGQEVLLFGDESIEFWRNTGATFPFERIGGTTLQNLGILCRHSVRDLNDIVFFVASDGTVRILNGYQPIRVSTHDVERSIDSVESKDSITATAYSIRGHQFYVLSSANWTWAYDATTGLWHERQSYGLSRWRGEGFVYINGTRAIGDYSSGVLYQLDPDTYDEAGNPLLWQVRTPPIHAYPNRLGFNRLFLDTVPGSGRNTGVVANDDPKIMLSWSDDGGKTFGTERTAAVGEIGEFNRRVKFERLGQSKEDGRIFDISMSAAVVRGLTGGAVDVDILDP